MISDCFIYSGIHPDNNSDEVSAIITDAVNLRNELIARVNNPDGADNPKTVRTYFKSIEKDFITGADKLFKRLSFLSEKKK